MFGRAGRWTQTAFATHFQPKKWNAHFWVMFNFWWSRLVDGLEPHLQPISSQEMLIFGIHSTSDDLVNGLQPHLPPLSPANFQIGQAGHEMLIFGLRSTSDDCQGLSIDSNSIHHPSPAKKMKCSFLDYIQILMISQVGRWTRTPSATSLQPKKMKCSFLDYVQLLMISQDWSMDSNAIQPHLPPLQKHEMLVFGLHSTSGDWPGWSCTQTPFATSLQPKKWNAHFWITFNFWWSAGLVNGLEPHLPPLSSQKKWNAHF